MFVIIPLSRSLPQLVYPRSPSLYKHVLNYELNIGLLELGNGLKMRKKFFNGYGTCQRNSYILSSALSESLSLFPRTVQTGARGMNNKVQSEQVAAFNHYLIWNTNPEF